MNKTRILVVDDHEVVRKGVAALLGGQPQWEVCGEASSGREAIAAAAELRPDVIVLDVSMPDMNGLDALRRILQERPRTEALILTMHESDQLVRQVFAAGARGYLLKSDAGAELIAAVDTVRRHKPYFTPKVVEAMMRGFITGGPGDLAGPAPADVLTSREREVVQLVAEGKSSKEIAGLLQIAPKTVEKHRANVMAKLELGSLSDLVRYAIRNHIVTG